MALFYEKKKCLRFYTVSVSLLWHVSGSHLWGYLLPFNFSQAVTNDTGPKSYAPKRSFHAFAKSTWYLLVWLWVWAALFVSLGTRPTYESKTQAEGVKLDRVS